MVEWPNLSGAVWDDIVAYLLLEGFDEEHEVYFAQVFLGTQGMS